MPRYHYQIVKVFSIVSLVLPCAYFIALAVTTALAKRWVGCGFAIALAVVSFVWLVLHFTYTSHEKKKKKSVSVTPAVTPEAPRRVSGQLALYPLEEDNDDLSSIKSTENGDEEIEVQMEESMLSSIDENSNESSMNDLKDGDAPAFAKLKRKPAKPPKNPLVTAGSSDPEIEHSTVSFIVPTDVHRRRPSSGKPPPEAVANLAKRSASTPFSPDTQFPPPTLSGAPAAVDRNGSAEEDFEIIQDTEGNFVRVRKMSNTPSFKLSKTKTNTAIALMYVTIIECLLLMGGSVATAYDTHCLFTAVPTLAMPYIYGSMSNLRYAFQALPPGKMRNYHIVVLRLLLHCYFVTFIFFVSWLPFIAALVLESVYNTPYSVDDVKTPTALRVVSYTAPFAMFCFVPVSASTVIFYQYQKLTRVYKKVSATAAEGTPALRVRQSGSTVRSGPRSTIFGGVGLEENDRLMSTIMEEEDSMSSIMRSSTSSSPRKKNGRRGASPSMSLISSTPRTRPKGNSIMTVPVLKTVTMLYIAYRDANEDAGCSPRREQSVRNKQQQIAMDFEALLEALDDTRENASADSNAYILTAFEDALCLVWGLLPFSSDPVCLAVEKARRFIKAFQDRPTPPTAYADQQPEVVAAVVYAPQSLLGMVGAGSFRSIHFFNSNQHDVGAALLERGFNMHRRLMNTVSSPTEGDADMRFNGILLDSRAAHSSANHILARPCGVIADASFSTFNRRRNSNMRKTKFTGMYDFLSFLNAKEEEWHLVVQRQEKLGNKFSYLTDAAQQLMQNNPGAAKTILQKALENKEIQSCEDNITLARMLMEDIDYIAHTQAKKM